MATDTTTTIARPYAKAAFEIALEAKSLAQWSDLLMILACVSLDAEVAEIIDEPGISEEKLASFFIDVAGKNIDEHGKNFVKILSHNKRLKVLPEIKATYEMLKSEQEKSLVVSVVSFSKMTEQQKSDLAASLKDKLQRDISINETIDESILGGAIIRAGDLVIDGSVRGRLEKLKTELAA